DHEQPSASLQNIIGDAKSATGRPRRPLLIPCVSSAGCDGNSDRCAASDGLGVAGHSVGSGSLWSRALASSGAPNLHCAAVTVSERATSPWLDASSENRWEGWFTVPAGQAASARGRRERSCSSGLRSRAPLPAS